LLQLGDPDEIINHVPDACVGCGADLGDAAGARVVRRQLHDIPTITPVVVERMHRRRCSCGATTTAAAPAGVGAATVYGPNLRALAVYLLVFQHIPVARTAALIADVTGARPSTGWVSSVLTATAHVLVDVEKLIKTLITLARVIHVDETSSTSTGRAGGCTSRAPTSSPRITCTAPVAGPQSPNSRSCPTTAAPWCTTRSASTTPTPTPAPRCAVHLARALTAAAEAHSDQLWPGQAPRALYGLNTAAHTAREQQLSHIPPEIADPLLTEWKHALLVGLAQHRRAPGRKQSKTRNLLERLRDRDEQVLLFARDLSVPFTNNQAERDVRPTKTQMKISGCHRSDTTARAWLRIRGYISTVGKHDDNILTALHDAITGNPWTPPQLA
jgi:transposase